MKLKSKKGTTIVEASMIFPLVISAVIAVLYIVVGLYSSLSLQTSLHLSLRKECGENTQTVYRLEKIKEYESEQDRINLRSVLILDATRDYHIGGILRHKVTRTESGRNYVIDEADIVRLRSMAKGES